MKKLLTKKTVRKTQLKTRKVGLDSFGNAIPEVPSAKVEGTGKALQIVETRDIIIAPPKAQRKARKVEKAAPVKVSWLSKVRSVFSKSEPKPAEQKAHDDLVDDLSHRMESAFTELKREFIEREAHLEQRLHEVKEHHALALTSQKTQKKWLLAGAGTVGFAMAVYLLVVMTSMEGSMSNMTGDMSAMSSHVQDMSGNTQAMTQSVSQMNDSMAYMNYSVNQLNGNVGAMNQNVAQMNQNVGSMSQSVKPMGEAAQTATPFMKFFKNFMPF